MAASGGKIDVGDTPAPVPVCAAEQVLEHHRPHVTVCQCQTTIRGVDEGEPVAATGRDGGKIHGHEVRKNGNATDSVVVVVGQCYADAVIVLAGRKGVYHGARNNEVTGRGHDFDKTSGSDVECRASAELPQCAPGHGEADRLRS